MAKELIIAQGTYKVGVDFPEGTFVFDSKGVDTTIEIEKNNDYDSFYLDNEHGYNARLTLNKGIELRLYSQMHVTKAEMITFD